MSAAAEPAVLDPEVHRRARRHVAQARLASTDIAADADRELLLSDLETIPSAG